MPQVVGHGDYHPRNILLPPGGDEVVAIDWGFCGPAPLGVDLGDLVTVAAWFCDVEVAEVPAVEQVAFEGLRGRPARRRLGGGSPARPPRVRGQCGDAAGSVHAGLGSVAART